MLKVSVCKKQTIVRLGKYRYLDMFRVIVETLERDAILIYILISTTNARVAFEGVRCSL